MFAKPTSVSATKVESRSLFERIKRFLRYYLLFPLFLLAIIGIWQYLRHHELFPIKRVTVIDKAAHLNPDTVKTITLKDVDEGFFRLSVKSLQSQLAGLPWVANVAVVRQWPDKVLIQFNEYKPVAIWNETSLITADGTVFTPAAKSQLPSSLPLLHGPNTQAHEIVTRYEMMAQMLAPLHRHIQALNVSDRLAWSLLLDNTLQVNLGEADPVKRLNAFVAVYPQVFTKTDQKADYVDMRYDHGLAVHWQKQQSLGV